ncbi:MAG: decarboxylating 6-phosphogluconate dehydrogenase [Candidatus Rifleibacteriota bacterium]
MKPGFIGLGKMGLNMVRRLSNHGISTICYDVNPELASEIAKIQNAEWADSLEAMVAGLPAPRVVWIMVPAGKTTENLILTLCDRLSPGDIIIDGGNSDYRDTIKLSAQASEKQINLIDVGTSGGIHGLERGYCLMVGGPKAQIELLSPVFKALAPENGWRHVGKNGNGHLVKMVHNAIEYGIMQSMAEGFNLLNKIDSSIDLGEVADLWNHNSVIESWLMELSAGVLANNNKLEELEPFVQDSGEGRWAVEAAINSGVPAPVFAAAVFARFSSRGEDDFGNRYLAALRNAFGGHKVSKKG